MDARTLYLDKRFVSVQREGVHDDQRFQHDLPLGMRQPALQLKLTGHPQSRQDRRREQPNRANRSSINVVEDVR